VISVLRLQVGPSPLWNGARRFYGPRSGRHHNVVPLPESQAKIPVCSTVARPDGSAVDLRQTNNLILIGIRAIHPRRATVAKPCPE
jgi:hypothetical protein